MLLLCTFEKYIKLKWQRGTLSSGCGCHAGTEIQLNIECTPRILSISYRNFWPPKNTKIYLKDNFADPGSLLFLVKTNIATSLTSLHLHLSFLLIIFVLASYCHFYCYCYLLKFSFLSTIFIKLIWQCIHICAYIIYESFYLLSKASLSFHSFAVSMGCY